MKKVTFLLAVFAMTLLLTACGAQKNELDIGHDLVKQGDCAGAAPYLEDTIAAPDDLMDMAYAYFLKGKCAEDSGNVDGAFENYYAAKIVACYAVANDVHVNLNTYARSEYCQKIIPEMLAKLEPSVSNPAAIKEKVDSVLHAKYLDQFVKK
ncbi:tetratricopeptide repeat protein [Pseudodesulfovibrio sp. zrk46]|uniref:tetratricopeptide repeat protein n=1 Tax=Pseudodesulfovibrio sp. zrk46 TaxID=2725288 RepID=UPI00144909B3|nr:tetratricopeptide repeat protein [Pseudodesulfovibrio sp. zrk46]QJB54884.1 tetratricopeptide repeat protein [Pseudodesulfovibrio sp. zrk46]